MDREELQQYDTINTNQSFNNSLNLRLDPDKILSDIYDFLSGTVTISDYSNDTNTLSQKKIVNGKPLANSFGIQNIMLKCRAIFNPQVVQGNYDDDRYSRDIKMLREELCLTLVLNRYKWDIQDVNCIVDTLMNFAKPFMSRTLYNKERESLSTAYHTRESFQMNPEKKSMISSFFN